MTAVAATLSRTALGGLTVYVAFLLSHAAHAADGAGGYNGSTAPPTPPPPSGGYGAGQNASGYATPSPNASKSPFAYGYGPQTPFEAGPSWAGGSGGQVGSAEPKSPPPVGSPTAYGPLPPPAPPFRDTPYGNHANPGPPGGLSYLHPNYPDYQTKYGVWYQPRSWWEPSREVYRPEPFRPRGWGNLFVDDPCRHDRMDYNRYIVKDLPSRYGPSYYPLYQPPSEGLLRPERHYKPPVWGSAE